MDIMAGETPGIRTRGDRIFVRHGDVSLGTTDSLHKALIMRDLYTIASDSAHVRLRHSRDSYAAQIAAVEGMDADERSVLCQELIYAFRLYNGTTLRPLINGRQVVFPTRAAAVQGILEARGSLSAECAVFALRLRQGE